MLIKLTLKLSIVTKDLNVIVNADGMGDAMEYVLKNSMDTQRNMHKY